MKKTLHKLPPLTAESKAERNRIRTRTYYTIRAYAEALVKYPRYLDGDGRDIGLDYDQIRSAVLRKFPTVPCNGPHKGKPTKLSYKDLQGFVCDLNRQGVKLPFRPRRKTRRKPKP